MKLERFLAERGDEWAELESLVNRAKGHSSRLAPAEVRRLGRLYRGAVSDLALARRLYPDTSGTTRLHGLVVAAHGLVYSRAGREGTVWQFVSRRFWQRVHAGGLSLAVSAGILGLSVILGLLWAFSDPLAASGILPAGFHVAAHPSHNGIVGIAIPARAGVATEIFTNNIKVSFFALAGGFTFGLLTAYLLIFNGLLLGVVAAVIIRAGDWGQFVSLIVPHGLLELSCIIVAGGAGLQIARALIDPGYLTRPQALRRLTPALADIILGVSACLVLSGFVEGVVTTWDLPVAAALAVGLGLGGAFWAMVVVRGMPGGSPPVPETTGVLVASD